MTLNQKTIIQLRNIWNKSNKDQLEFCGDLCFDKKRQYLVVKPTVQLKESCEHEPVCDVNFHTHIHSDRNLTSCKFNNLASAYDINPPSADDCIIFLQTGIINFIITRMGIWQILSDTSIDFWENLNEDERAGFNNYFHSAQFLFYAIVEKYGANIAINIYFQMMKSFDFENFRFDENYFEFSDGKYFVTHDQIKSQLSPDESEDSLVDIFDEMFFVLNDFVGMKLMRVQFHPF